MIIEIQGSEIRIRNPHHAANTRFSPPLLKLVTSAQNLSLATPIFTPRNEKLDLEFCCKKKKTKQNNKMNQKVHLCNPGPQLQTQKKAD
jgi:hypothetical protein